MHVKQKRLATVTLSAAFFHGRRGLVLEPIVERRVKHLCLDRFVRRAAEVFLTQAHFRKFFVPLKVP